MVPAIKKNLNEIWIETLVKCDGIDHPPLNDIHLNVSEVSTSLITRSPAKSGTMVSMDGWYLGSEERCQAKLPSQKRPVFSGASL